MCLIVWIWVEEVMIWNKEMDRREERGERGGGGEERKEERGERSGEEKEKEREREGERGGGEEKEKTDEVCGFDLILVVLGWE